MQGESRGQLYWFKGKLLLECRYGWLGWAQALKDAC